MSKIVGLFVTWVLLPTFLLSLVAQPLAVAWNTLSLKGVAVTGGATSKNAENLDNWFDEGRNAVADGGSDTP